MCRGRSTRDWTVVFPLDFVVSTRGDGVNVTRVSPKSWEWMEVNAEWEDYMEHGATISVTPESFNDLTERWEADGLTFDVPRNLAIIGGTIPKA